MGERLFIKCSFFLGSTCICKLQPRAKARGKAYYFWIFSPLKGFALFHPYTFLLLHLSDLQSNAVVVKNAFYIIAKNCF